MQVTELTLVRKLEEGEYSIAMFCMCSEYNSTYATIAHAIESTNRIRCFEVAPFHCLISFLSLSLIKQWGFHESEPFRSLHLLTE